MRALDELKKECFRRIGHDICFCCGESKLKRLLAHHRSYTSKSVTYNKWGNSDDERLKYYSNLLDEINYDHGNFLIMCFNCHKQLEDLLLLASDAVLLLARQKKLMERMILAYDVTRIKRNLSMLHQPFDHIIGPNFIIEFNDKLCSVLSDDLDDDEVKELIKTNSMLVLKRIEEKSLSINDFAESVILSEPPENYIMSYGVADTFKMLEPFMKIKKGDKISYVHTINNNHCYKPIELVNKAEIDSKWYYFLFCHHIIDISKGLITENDIDEISGKLQRTGLDEFFWN